MAKDYINGEENLEPWPRPAMASPGERTYLDIDIGRIPASVLYANDMAGLAINVVGQFPGPAGTQTGGLEGLRVSVTPTGTDGRRLAGIYASVNIVVPDQPGVWEVVTGFYCAGEFEVNTINTGDQSIYAVLQLRDINTNVTHGAHAARSFIRLRSSTVPPLNLFNFANEDVASAHDSGRMVVETGDQLVGTMDVMIRCLVGATPVWLWASSGAPN